MFGGWPIIPLVARTLRRAARPSGASHTHPHVQCLANFIFGAGGHFEGRTTQRSVAQVFSRSECVLIASARSEHEPYLEGLPPLSALETRVLSLKSSSIVVPSPVSFHGKLLQYYYGPFSA